MLRATRVFLLTLLSLLLYVKCSDFYVEVQKRLAYVSGRMGACGEYFDYQRTDEFVTGKLELPNIKLGDTVKMTFYRIVFRQQTRFNGILLPDENSQEVINKIQNGQMITYRVDFPISRNVPVLIKILVNGNELCTTQHNQPREDYEILVLKHTMQITNGFLPVFTYNINIPNFVENPTLQALPLDSLSVETPTCGLVDEEIGLSPLIHGGSEVVPGEYPWLAAIYKKRGTEIDFLCGGSLVTTKIILTAAHCFQESFSSADKIVVILGRYNLSSYLVDSYVKNEIEALILHPEYKYGIGFSDADLAILRMKNSVSFSKFIKPICLWFEPADETLFVNQTGVVAGWGSDELAKKINVNIVTEDVCLRSSVAFNAITSKRTLCAGNRDGTGPCEGDSGGGLMIKHHGRWMLRGVISAGLTEQNRCNLQEYTVYCDLAKHTEWLEQYIGKEKFQSGSIEEICGISGTYSRSKYPWLAAVYIKVATGLKFVYTGVLISSRTVLTRAGVIVNADGTVSSPDYFRIYLGRYDLNNIHEHEVVMRDVATFVFHPDYDQSTKSPNFQDNDIVLIQMKSPVDFTEYVRPICLWSEPNVGQPYNEGHSSILSGWDLADVYLETSTVPMSIEVNITSIEQCQSWGYDESRSSRIFCMPKLETKDGGILMFKRNGRLLFRGINAGRGNPLTYMSKSYFVYFDIAKYLPWIQANMLS